ncbi:MAG: xylulokinase [Phycisphaerales bacterium]|nr:xylulokinase [Phycisphaerales bacterium]
MFLGIDIGTSSTKGVVCDPDGRVIEVASAPHPLHRPKPGWSEQDPHDWWTSVSAVCTALSHHAIEGLAFSGQMHGSVFLDEHDEVIRPALLWNDQRTASQCEAIERAAGGREGIVALVGNAALPGFTLPKILWLREHEPSNFARLRHVMLPKDYIAWRLTGCFATDVGDGAGTLLLDVDRRDWSEKALALFDIDRAMLPPVLESGTEVGRLTGEAARGLGLRADIPVIIGSGDNQMGAIGAGVVGAGAVLAALGTSGVIYAHATEPRRDAMGRIHTMCAATGRDDAPGGWCVTGCMLSAAGSLQWMRDTLCPDVSFEHLVQEASSVESEGLYFLPHLTGERCPYQDPEATGGWVGLTSRHTRAHMVRAVIEGVTFTMGRIIDIMREAGVGVERVRLGGGGARSPFWRQMQADVYGVPVELPTTEEGPAFGAALLAGVGAGAWGTLDEACSTLEIKETRDPSRDVTSLRAVQDTLYGRIGNLGA